MPTKTQKVEFPGALDAKLAARLDMPRGRTKAWAIFAHCFTCTKDIHATRNISAALAEAGVAVLRFDFTGLGGSGGDFASTNFSSNREDLKIAADFLRQNHEAPSLLIGHSLGGAAVLSVAGEIPEIKAVATIGAPAHAEHVLENFSADFDQIDEEGKADVVLAGRKFSIQKQFVEDLRSNDVLDRVKSTRAAFLVLHSPIDQTVGVENATEIFASAKHPKSFVSLDGADHLLSNPDDGRFAADMIASWFKRYMPQPSKDADSPVFETDALIRETGVGKFQNEVFMGDHYLLADEPESVGGMDSGPGPYDLLAASLGTCTAMTLRMYADFKKMDIGQISVAVDHQKVHADDCTSCAHELAEKGGKIDHFERTISSDQKLDPEITSKLLEIADKCPVHRSLEKGAHVSTTITET